MNLQESRSLLEFISLLQASIINEIDIKAMIYTFKKGLKTALLESGLNKTSTFGGTAIKHLNLSQVQYILI
ncbi:hypothetical protein IM40_00750 [Candidatus Paracaedimonas acanthamoebae]|nr:hypothetical protein IM40_00750 [Candidatus Paracaedimonas acanthamoebae]